MTTKRTKTAGETTPPDALTELQTRVFPHPHQLRAVDRAVSAALRPGGKQLVVIYGPPGAGKTKTCDLVENLLAHHFRGDLEADPRTVRVVRTEAPAAVGTAFAWREFLIEAIGALGDPVTDRLVGTADLDGTAPGPQIRPARLGANEMLRIAARRYKRRGVRVLLIDEAQHIAVAPKLIDVRRDLDVLKGFANRTGVRIVLIGTYELLRFHQASGQLARRMNEIHLARYRWTVAHEQAAFADVAREMLGCIKGLDEAAITESIESCYERSLGCVGELRDWLVQAEHEFRTSGRSWSACLAETASAVGKATHMLDGVEESEGWVRTGDAGRPRLRLRLGLSAVGSRKVTPEPKAAKRPLRVGRRRPTRDRVGPSDA